MPATDCVAGPSGHPREGSFSPGVSASVRKANYLAQTIALTIAGKMTPVLQATDADVAVPLKTATLRAENALFVEKRERAWALNQPTADLDCDNADLLEILCSGVGSVVEQNGRGDVVLKAAVRNGFLYFKPGVNGKRQRRATDVMSEEWLTQHPFEGHRMPHHWRAYREGTYDDAIGAVERAVV